MVLRNRKGSITDLPYIMAGIFGFAITVVLISLLVYHTDDRFQDISVIDSRAKDASEDMSTGFPDMMNGAIVFVFFVLCVISLVLASLVEHHPAFLIFYILEWVLLVVVGAGIANAYQAVIEHEALSVISSSFTLSTSFFRFFPFVVAIMGMLLAIIMYKARRAVFAFNGR